MTLDALKAVLIPTLCCMIGGYLIGSFNLSYLMSRVKGFDIRKYGSGNAGASNVIIVMGRKMGFIVMIVDILKAFFAVKIAALLFPNATIKQFNYAAVVAGMSVIIGHIIPFYMNFKGGKGLASLGGVILALDAKVFVVLLIVSVLIAVATDYLCFVPISMALIFPIVYGYMKKSFIAAGILLISSLFIWYRHIENLQRIKSGDELKFHFLWNRKNEAARFGIADDGMEIFEHNRDEEDIQSIHE